MNKISRLFYTMVMLPAKLYRQWGIDTAQLALILGAKLTMDDRRPNTFQQTRINRKKEGVNNAMIGTMVMALLMGLINLIAFAFGKDDITHFSFLFLAFMFLLASVLITDFTAVLIDVRDNMILLPRPINDRTILMAKLLHIIVHLCRVILPMSLPVLIYVGMNYSGWAVLTLFVLVLLASLFAIFLVNAVYLFVLKLMSPEKFKSFIAWFQVGFVIFLYGGYQIFLRLTNRSDFQEFSIAENKAVRLFPPYWFARAWDALNGGGLGEGWPWLLICLVTSLGSIWVVVRFLAPAFNRKLSMIHGSGEQQANTASTRAAGGRGLAEFLAGNFTKDPVSRAGFLFTWRWTNRNRGFRMRVYPTIGYVVVWIILMVVNRSGEVNGSIANAASAPYAILMLIYLSSFITISAMQHVAATDEYKAAWIFYTYPVEKPGSVIRGSFISLLSKFYLPIGLLLLVGGLLWKGPAIIPNMIFGLSNQLAICCCILLINKKSLPASRPLEMKDRGGSFLKSMLMLMITGTIGVVHFMVYKFTAVIILLALLSLLANWLLLKRIGEIGWREIKELT